ncbi:uncharacterized protein A4U43_C04F11380 [Asparagus officinalis]|uniref:Uncharacterized protein n=1 Tax=Asparagus officinalis TaxID=4686 RepID=A0A5P1F0Q8_ASPOF|nr:uncharacterized protein A4U43_C04F11380 [Asparagus officinalis]
MDSGESPRSYRVHRHGHLGHPRGQSGLEPSAVGSSGPAHLRGPLKTVKKLTSPRAKKKKLTLNGLEFVLGKVLPPAGFKVSVVGLRCLNNVLG